MPFEWEPARRRGVEILDDPSTPDDVRLAAMADLPRSNALFGGTTAVLNATGRILAQLPPNAVVVDVGAGTGDVSACVREQARARGLSLTVIGADLSPALLRAHPECFGATMAADAQHLPLRDGAADLVICSQLLHHFENMDARTVIGELNRISRGWVLIADLRRSRAAAAGFWLASTMLRFHPVTRRDGVTSVFRGFTARELHELVHECTGAEPEVRSGAFWRVSAVWPACRPMASA